MSGFFTPSTLQQSKPANSKLPQCGACGCSKTCSSPKIPLQGKGEKGILVLGDFPRSEEDKQGRFFCGSSSQLLRRKADQLGISLNRDCWLSNALICRPPKEMSSWNEQVDFCRPNVFQAIEEKKPKVIILLGGLAIRSVIGGIWNPAPGGIEQWAGFQVPSQKLNAWICPVFDPYFVARNSDENEKSANPVVAVWWERHLRAAFSLQDRPWDQPRDYDSEIRVLWKTETVKKALSWFIRQRNPCAIDFETDRLKPDNSDSKIVSCAVSNGERTVSFLWTDEIREAAGELFFSDVPKIAANAKFEQRWCIAEFGKPMKKIMWDTVLAAHILDNRRSITSVKFQAFALLGYSGSAKQRRYDEVAKSYFQAEGGNGGNRIYEMDMTQLLHYGGLDALLEWELAMKQRSQF